MTRPRVLLASGSEMAATDIDLHQARLRKKGDFRPLADITPIMPAVFLPRFSPLLLHRSDDFAFQGPHNGRRFGSRPVKAA
jgi:hypothetical protein